MVHIMENGGLVFDKIPERPNIYESAELALQAHLRELKAWISQGKTKEEAVNLVFSQELNSKRIGELEKEMINKAIKLFLEQE